MGKGQNDGGEIMKNAFWVIVLFLVFSPAGNSQMKTPADIGIDEKLGMTVAMDTVLKDENGNDITLRRLVDRPTILMFNYFRCPGICPVLISNVVEVINEIELEPGKDLRLVAVSFDPLDTPEIARQKKANYLNQIRRPFSPDSWHFLTGSAENTKAVADSAGFNYQKQGDMYVHPGAIIVLTPKGVISRYLYGTSFLTADVTMATEEAARGKVRPTISKVLSFCYTYDPEGRKYVFSVTRVVGAAILIFAVVFVVFITRRRKDSKAQG
jgi:protein SCO1